MAEEMSQIKKGKFIVFEGIDGAGKSTIGEYIQEYLMAHSLMPTILTKEPTDSYIGRQIRDSLLGISAFPPRKILASMFAADRYYHTQWIKEVLQSGTNVICDRYIWSNYAYNSNNALEDHLIDELHTSEKWYLAPDYIIYLDVDPEIGFKRIQRRFHNNSFDKLDILKRASERYAEVLSAKKNFKVFTRVFGVNANLSLGNVKSQIEACLGFIFGKGKP